MDEFVELALALIFFATWPFFLEYSFKNAVKIMGIPLNFLLICLFIGLAASQPNPEEAGNYLEGDIIIGKSSGSVQPSSRAGVRNFRLRWRNRTVPYAFHVDYRTQTLIIN